MSDRLWMPSLAVARSCGDFEQLWRHLSNDIDHAYRTLFGDVFDTDVPASLGAGDPALWPRFATMLDTLDAALDIVNELLALSGVDDADASPSATHRLDALVAAVGENGALAQDALLASLVREVLGAFHLYVRGFETDVQSDGTFAHIYRLSSHAESHADGPDDAPPFDVFISYRHARYTKQARDLHDALTARGFHCWLDQEQLMIPTDVRVDERELKRKLRQAVMRSRSMIFFETYDVARADPDHRGSHTVFNWQVFERHFAGATRVIADGAIYSFSGFAERFTSSEQMLELLERFVRNASEGERQRWRTHDEPQLELAPEGLAELSADYFGRPVEIARRAVLALLAPPAAPMSHAYSADQLLNLVRLSPRAALLMLRAGFDLEKLFEVGAAFNEVRWSEPRELLFDDTFGHRSLHAQVEECSRIADRGRLDETNLLVALLELGRTERTFAGELLSRTVRYMHSRLPDEEVAGLVERFAGVCISAARGENYELVEQQWLLERSDVGGWQLTPFAPCTDVTFEPAPGSPVPLRVAVTQTDRFFATLPLRALNQAVSEDGRGALDALFVAKTPLAFVLPSTTACSLAVISRLQRHAPRADPVFFEWLGVADAFAAETAVRVASAADLPERLRILKALVAEAAPVLEAEPTPPLPATPGGLGPRRVVAVIGAGPPRVLGRAMPAPPLRTLDLHTQVLRWLRRYEEVRALDRVDLF